MSKFVFERSNEQLHKQLLDLMVVFKEICDKEGIWYSLAFGTMLGAVRHEVLSRGPMRTHRIASDKRSFEKLSQT